MKILYTFILLVSIFYISVGHSNKNSVSTEVTVQSVFTQLWRNTHPSKFFKCWGKPEEVEAYQKDLKKTYRTKSGRFGGSLVDNSRANFPEYVPQLGEWSSSLNEDRVFKLSFSQKVKKEQTSYRHHACSTERFLSQLDSIANTFKSNASIFIPEGIYLVRIKRLKFTSESSSVHELSSTVKNAQRVEAKNSALNLSLSQHHVGEYDYFFVNPGERLDFEVTWRSQSVGDASFQVDYQVQLLGQDECQKNLWDPVNSPQQDLKKLVEEKFSEQQFINDPYKIISRMSCLRTKPYVDFLLRSHHGSDLVKLLEHINHKFESYDNSQTKNHLFYREVWVVVQMTLYDIARIVLQDLYKFCDSKLVFPLHSSKKAKPIKIRGYHFASRQYYKIRLLFERAPMELLDTFSSTLSLLEGKGLNYRAVVSSETLDILEELQFSFFQGPFQTVGLIGDLFKELPQVSVNSNSTKSIQKNLLVGMKLFDLLNLEFRQQLLKFSAQSLEKIDRQVFAEALSKYKLHLRNLRSIFEDDFNWFAVDKKLSLQRMPFARDLLTLNLDLMAVSGTLLKRNYGFQLGESTNSNFLRIKEMNKLYEDVNHCLRSAQ